MNELALHPQKTRLVVHGTKIPLNVTLQNVLVQEIGQSGEASAGLLGVELEPNFRWNTHIASVVSKLKKGFILFL